MIDECQNLQSAHKTDGEVSLATENARQVQEDCHRFALQPGAAVTYRLQGPINKYRIYSFARNENTTLDVSHSANGDDFQAATIERRAFPSSQTVYGYLTPVLFEGDVPGETVTYLRIELPKSSPYAKLETASRLAGQPAPVEISRVEIAYDLRSSEAIQGHNRRPE